jgi:hypothetical protein
VRCPPKAARVAEEGMGKMGTVANPELCLPKATAEVVARAVQCLPRPALLA